jgi:hypothetical protein
MNHFMSALTIGVASFLPIAILQMAKRYSVKRVKMPK